MGDEKMASSLNLGIGDISGLTGKQAFLLFLIGMFSLQGQIQNYACFPFEVPFEATNKGVKRTNIPKKNNEGVPSKSPCPAWEEIALRPGQSFQHLHPRA